MISGETSLSDNLDQHSFLAATVEFAVENLFPRTEIEFAVGDGDDDFAAHDLAFQVGVGVVFAGAVVSIGGGRRVRREFFQPDVVIVMQPALVVVDEDRCGDVHGVDQTKAFAHAALIDEFLDLRRDVDEAASVRNFKPKMFGERFHVREVDGLVRRLAQAPLQHRTLIDTQPAGDMIGAVPEEKATRGASRYDAIIATFVGFCALCVSGYTAYMQRQQVRAAVWPILQFDSSNGPIHFTLANKGVGPAIIKHVIVKVDDQPVKNWAEVLEKILGPGISSG